MDTLLHAALSNAAVAAVLALIVTLIGRVSRRPALVHSLWLLVLLKLLTPPLWPVPLWWLVRSEAGQVTTDSVAFEAELPAGPVDFDSRGALTEEGAAGVAGETVATAAQAAALLDPAPSLPEAPPAAKALSLPETSNPDAPVTSSSVSWQASVLAIWLSGSILWLALAGFRLYRFHRLFRFTQPAPPTLQARARHLADRLGLARCPGVWVVPAPVSPLLWTLAGQPRLLVPASLLERLTEEQWDTLLAHELAHLRRRDHWVRMLELAALALYWWHPAVWWARRQLREAEEECCDAWVVWALPGAAEAYATALVEAVTYLSDARSALPLAASGIGQMHLLKRRLTMIMRGTTPRALSAGGSLAVLGLAAVLLPLWPTWARTEQRREDAGDQQTPGGAGATEGRPGGAAGLPGASSGAGAQDHPPSGAVGGGEGGGAGTGLRNQYYTVSFAEGRAYPETVEDAQDEVDLLRVQLDLRRAERREVEARLRQAKSDLQRYPRAGGTIGLSEVEHARTEVEVQEARVVGKDAQIKEAELRLKQAQRRLTKLRAQAPRTPEGKMGPRGEGPTGAKPVPQTAAVPGATMGGSRAAPGKAGEAVFGPGAGGIPGGYRVGPGVAVAPGGPGSAGFGGTSTGFGAAPSYEHRLAEVEKKLEELLREVKALRQERQPEKEKPSKR